MLVTLKEILKVAEEEKCALGAFNTPNMTSIQAVIGAAEELNRPVVMMHAQIHEEMGVCKMDEIAPVMLLFAERAKVPVCVHLDHGEDLEYIRQGLKLGFTSVMYDGSTLENAENYANTSRVVELAKTTGASVEGEIGSMGERDAGESSEDESIYTDPMEAKSFSEETGIDALSCAFGMVHGLYLKEPKLDFDRVKRIHELVRVPLVAHGGSGVSEADFKRLIKLGIRKVNYYTYMAKAGGAAAANVQDKTLFHNIELAAQGAMKEDVKSAIRVFSR